VVLLASAFRDRLAPGVEGLGGAAVGFAIAQHGAGAGEFHRQVLDWRHLDARLERSTRDHARSLSHVYEPANNVLTLPRLFASGVVNVENFYRIT
jgi:hypothetical protein